MKQQEVKTRTGKKRGFASPVIPSVERAKEARVDNYGRDFTKWSFNGLHLSKGKLALEIVRAYVSKHPDTTYTKLKRIFSDELVRSYGVFVDAVTARKVSARKQRYYVGDDQLIRLKNGKVISVTNQFTNESIRPLVQIAKQNGMRVRHIG